VPPIFMASLHIERFLGSLLSSDDLLRSRSAIRRLVCVRDTNVKDACRVLVPESLHQQVSPIEEVSVMVSGLCWRGSGGRSMCVRRCRGLSSIVVVTYYNFRFVTYTICTQCLYRESTTFVSHFVMVAHHQAALFALECMVDRKSTTTPVTLFLQIPQF